MILRLVLPFACFIFFVAFHVLILHFLPVKRRFTVMLSLMALSCGLYAAVFLSLPVAGDNDKRTFELLTGIFLYVTSFFFYYQVLLLIDRSVSLRMMIEVRKAGESGLTADQIKSRYSFDEKFREEVKDMLLLSWVKEENGSIRNCRRASIQARVFGFLKSYLNLSKHR
jgi:hypothetical protein